MLNTSLFGFSRLPVVQVFQAEITLAVRCVIVPVVIIFVVYTFDGAKVQLFSDNFFFFTRILRSLPFFIGAQARPPRSA